MLGDGWRCFRHGRLVEQLGTPDPNCTHGAKPPVRGAVHRPLATQRRRHHRRGDRTRGAGIGFGGVLQWWSYDGRDGRIPSPETGEHDAS